MMCYDANGLGPGERASMQALDNGSISDADETVARTERRQQAIHSVGIARIDEEWPWLGAIRGKKDLRGKACVERKRDAEASPLDELGPRVRIASQLPRRLL